MLGQDFGFYSAIWNFNRISTKIPYFLDSSLKSLLKLQNFSQNPKFNFSKSHKNSLETKNLALQSKQFDFKSTF